MQINQEYKDAIDLERGRAIDAFAKLESTLCWILSEAGRLEYQTASTIFYSNISLQPRVEIISAIIEEMCGAKFEVFWASACKAINSLNKQRNKIVHWHSYPVYDGKKELENTKFTLIHPVIKGEKFSELSTHDIGQFIEKTNYLINVLSKFRLCFDSSIPVLQKIEIELFATNVFKFPPVENDPFISN